QMIDDEFMNGNGLSLNLNNNTSGHKRRDSSSTTSTARERRKIVGRHFIARLFEQFDDNNTGLLSLQEVRNGLDHIIQGYLLIRMQLFFDMHDLNKDGKLSRDEILGMSESFLFIFRYEEGDNYLSAVSNFIRNAFEFAEKVDATTRKELDSNSVSTKSDTNL